MSIGLLSWGSHKTLEQTLDSYREFGLHNRSDKIIYFQQISDEDRRIAQKYHWKFIGTEENVGIAEGYRALVNEAQDDFFLFLENDWRLIERVGAAFADGLFLLGTGQADLIRYRHRKNPGNPLWTRQFEGNEYAGKTHLLDSIHWADPDRFPEIVKRPITTSYNPGPLRRDWYITTARYANWTNNPHMAYTSFLKYNVLPHIGTGNLEGALQGWWEQQDFKVAQGEGLFTHDRVD